MKKTKVREKPEKQVDEYDEDYEAPKKWYDNVAEDGDSKPVTEQVLIDLKDEAHKCLESETQNFKIKSSRGDSKGQWMKTIMNKGTMADKIAAHIVTIQDNPVYNLDTLRNLVGMVKVGKKKECVSVMESLTELFISDLLRPNRKLKPFHQRPLSQLMELSSGNAITRRKLLSLWYFEDQLKEIYASFVLAVNTVSHDTVESNKEKAITAMYKLLAGNSEQEQNLLKYIVNKLGDPSPKVASKAIYCLTQLLKVHNNMQGVVLNEIEKVLFRPNISTRAQYYSLCFLSQFYLSHETSDVARKLIEVYFSFFKACVKQGDVDSRMMSVLLIGLKRAFPFAKMEMSKISEHIDTMYRLVHIASFNISLHALTLLYQVSSQGNNINDRFYNALYRKLFDPKLLVTTYQAMLLSLVYKALLKDNEQVRIKMFIKRLLQIALFTPPNFTTGILYLISQLMGKRQNLQSVILQQIEPKNLDEDEDDEETYIDADKKSENSVEETKPDEILTNAAEVEDVKPDVEELQASISGPSWFHCKNVKDIKPVTKYTPLARNPLYGGAQFCAYTELNLLKTHFHPTVALYAENILSGEIIKYNGDPLEDFTLIRFLDRFVFKNPKKLEDKAGVNPLFAKRKLYKPRGVKSLSVNSVNYLRESSSNIPADELFLHEFLQRRYINKQVHVKEENDDSDLESVQSEEFEEMLDKMAGVSNEDEEIDFINEIGDKLQMNTKKDKKKSNSNDEFSDESGEDDGNDEDLEDDDDLEEDMDEDEFLGMEDDDKELIDDLDDEEEDIEFNEDDRGVLKKFKKNKNDLNTLFASADEFATLLDDEGSSKVAPGSSRVFANKDNANVKQLAWEEKRNHWLNGFNNAVGGGKKRKGAKGFSNKNKRKRK